MRIWIQIVIPTASLHINIKYTCTSHTLHVVFYYGLFTH